MQYKIISFFLVLGLFFSGCEEAYVPIQLVQPTGDRVVVLEEYSGGSCVPCSEAHKIIENLTGLYGDKLIVVTMHTDVGGTANPLPEATYNFITTAGSDIFEYLGYPDGIPSGVVNRTAFPGGNGLQLTKQQWAGAISEESQKEANMLMNIDTEYDEASRKVSISVDMVPLEDITDDIVLTVMITESEIIDWQATPDGHVEDYEHNHILRAVISPTFGTDVGSFTKDEAKKQTYEFTLPEADGSGPWIPANCEIVAFVSVNDPSGERKEILQGAHTGVVE